MSKSSMTEMLKVLSSYQAQALDKYIDFELDLHFNDKKVPYADVKLYCSVAAGDNVETHMFTTTFSEDYCTSKNNGRMKKVEDFIQTTTLYSEK